MRQEDVNVEVQGDNTLVLQGERKDERQQERGGVWRSERSYGSFSRRLELPNGVNPDDIKAHLAHGVLKVTVPKPPPAQAKKGVQACGGRIQSG